MLLHEPVPAEQLLRDVGHAQQAGFDVKYLEKTGLVIRREEDGRRYDRFRGRVMFPIHNISGRVVGFGARRLTT